MKTYTTMDRSNWPSGEWDSEPDKAQWKDDETGMVCLAVRNTFGAWCGYVGLNERHPLYEKDYSDDLAQDIKAHCGLTFADHCQPSKSEATGICHVPEQGDPDNVWWLGFDCLHYLDIAPESVEREPIGRNLLGWELVRRELMRRAAGDFPLAEYRTLEYVRKECASLAMQLKRMHSE